MNPEEGDYRDNVTLGSENPVTEEFANDSPGLPLQSMARDASMPVCDEDEESPAMANHEEDEPMFLSVSSAQEIRDRELHGCSNLNTEHVELLSHADEPKEPSTSGQNVEPPKEHHSCVQSAPIEFESASSSAAQQPILFGQEAECDYSLSPVSEDGKCKVWEETVEHEEMTNSVNDEQACGFIDEQQSAITMQEELPGEHAADTADEEIFGKIGPESENDDARFSCVLCSARFALETDVASHVRSHDISMFYRRVKRQDGMVVESEGDVDRKNDEVDHDHCDSGKEGQEGSGDVSHSEISQQHANEGENDAHRCGQCDRRYGTKRGLDLHVIFTHKGKRKSTEVEMLRSSLQKYAAATVNLPERRRTVKESSGSVEKVNRLPKTVGGNNSASRQVGSAPSYVCLHCLHVVSFEGRNVKSRYNAYSKMWKHVVSVHAKKTARTNVDFVTGLGAGNVPSSGRILKAAAPTGNIMCQKCGKGFQTNRARAIHAAHKHGKVRKLLPLPYPKKKGKSNQQTVHHLKANICGTVYSCLYCVHESRCFLTKRECVERRMMNSRWHQNAYHMIHYHVRTKHKKPCIQGIAFKLKSNEKQVTTPSSDIGASPRVSQHFQSPRKKAITSPTEQAEILVKDSALQQQQCGIVYSCAHCTSFHTTCELSKDDCTYYYDTCAIKNRIAARRRWGHRHRVARERTRSHLHAKHDTKSFKLGIDYTRSGDSEHAAAKTVPAVRYGTCGDSEPAAAKTVPAVRYGTCGDSEPAAAKTVPAVRYGTCGDSEPAAAKTVPAVRYGTCGDSEPAAAKTVPAVRYGTCGESEPAAAKTVPAVRYGTCGDSEPAAAKTVPAVRYGTCGDSEPAAAKTVPAVRYGTCGDSEPAAAKTVPAVRYGTCGDSEPAAAKTVPAVRYGTCGDSEPAAAKTVPAVRYGTCGDSEPAAAKTVPAVRYGTCGDSEPAAAKTVPAVRYGTCGDSEPAAAKTVPAVRYGTCGDSEPAAAKTMREGTCSGVIFSCLHCSTFRTACDGGQLGSLAHSVKHNRSTAGMRSHIRYKHSKTGPIKRFVDYKIDTTMTTVTAAAEKSTTPKRKHTATVPSIAAKKKDNSVLSKTPRVSDPEQPCCSTQPSTSSPAKTKTASCVPVPATSTASATSAATTTSISFACTRCPYITPMYMDIRGHCAQKHPDDVAGRMIQHVLDYTKIFS